MAERVKLMVSGVRSRAVTFEEVEGPQAYRPFVVSRTKLPAELRQEIDHYQYVTAMVERDHYGITAARDFEWNPAERDDLP